MNTELRIQNSDLRYSHTNSRLPMQACPERSRRNHLCPITDSHLPRPRLRSVSGLSASVSSTAILLLATLFSLLLSCSPAGQFTLTDTTDDFGVKVLEGTPITLRQGGYDVGVVMTPEMRDNDIEQIMFLHIEHKGKKPHQFTSMSIVIENLPLHYVDLLDYETETTEKHVYERFSLKVDFRDLEMILDSKFLRFNGELNTMGFFLDDGPRRHLRTFRDACLARADNR